MVLQAVGTGRPTRERLEQGDESTVITMQDAVYDNPVLYSNAVREWDEVV